jgi:hypothetical protein
MRNFISCIVTALKGRLNRQRVPSQKKCRLPATVYIPSPIPSMYIVTRRESINCGLARYKLGSRIEFVNPNRQKRRVFTIKTAPERLIQRTRVPGTLYFVLCTLYYAIPSLARREKREHKAQTQKV